MSFRCVSFLPEKSSWQCWALLAAYAFVVAGMIFSEMRRIRQQWANLTADAYFTPGSFPNKFFRHPFTILAFGLFGSLLASVSLLVFVSVTEKWALFILLLDAVAFGYVYYAGPHYGKLGAQPTASFSPVVGFISRIIMNSLCLVVLFVLVDCALLLSNPPSENELLILSDPDAVATHVVGQVKSCCWWFQTLLRLAYLNDYLTRSLLLNLDLWHSVAFWVLYLLHLKTVPAISASLFFCAVLRGE
jgi:hypothetical protein